MELPGDWFNRDAEKIKKEMIGWPDWMKAGVQELSDRAERRMLNDDQNKDRQHITPRLR